MNYFLFTRNIVHKTELRKSWEYAKDLAPLILFCSNSCFVQKYLNWNYWNFIQVRMVTTDYINQRYFFG